MNRLEKRIEKIKNYPTWLFSALIGRAVPFTGTAGIQYEKMSQEEVIVSLQNRRKVRNHIGQIHAAGMILLAETATGMVVGMNVPDDKIPLIKSMETNFVKRSTGAMRAVAHLSAEQIEQIRTLEKGEVQVPVTVTDEAGVEPVLVEAIWAWIPKKKQ
jgi:acyl-coenzyme A thioesterase PaaI-like protein